MAAKSEQWENDGWIPWTPSRRREAVYADVARAVDAFKPVDRDAGTEAANWLQQHALEDFPASLTWLLCEDGRVEGFFAIRSGNFRISPKRGRRPRRTSFLKPASEIIWMCKHADSPKSGQVLLMRAAALATKVSAHQGNIALVINPYDQPTGRMLNEKYAFLESARSGQLWLPVLP